MRGDEHNPQDWFDLAIKDLERARRRWDEKDLEDCLFRLAQSAEKAIKGKLIERGWQAKTIHDLPALIHTARAFGIHLRYFRSVADLLKIEYMATRYPSNRWDPLPEDEEVKDALQATEKLVNELCYH